MRPMTMRRGTRLGLFAMISWGICLLQTPSAAGPEAPAPPSAEPANAPTSAASAALGEANDLGAQVAMKRAAEAFKAARALSAKKQWGAALLQYHASARMGPSWSARVGIGGSLEMLQRYDEALDAYEGTLRDFGSSVPPKVKMNILERIDVMRRETGALMITGATPGALVLVDGRLRGEHPLPAPVATLAGRHLIRVYKEGFIVHEEDVEVAKGGMETLAVTLKPLENAGRLDVAEDQGRTMEVVVDGVPVGQTPWSGPVSPGPHAVALRPITPREDPRRGACGNLDEESVQQMTALPEAIDLGTEPVTVNVAPGKSTPLTLKAEPLDALIRIMPNPPTAEVFIDGVSVGRGPYTGRTRKGKHVVKLVADGYFPVTEQLASKPGDEVALARELPKDLNAPRWVVRGRYLVEARAAVVLAPSLGGELAAKCGATCLQSLGVGVRAALRGGYELPSGLGFGGSVGYFKMNQARTGQEATIRVNQTDLDGMVNDETTIEAVALGAQGSYRLGQRFPLRLGLGAGVLLGTVSYSRVGIFANKATGPTQQTGFFPWIYAEPEADIGFRITEGWSIGVNFSGMILMAPRVPLWTETMFVNAHGKSVDEIGQFKAETITSPVLFAMTQGIHIRYGF
jgi:PEGA domain